MELKKQRLLLMLQPSEEEKRGVADAVEQRVELAEKEESAESGGGVDGMKCRAPLKEVRLYR